MGYAGRLASDTFLELPCCRQDQLAKLRQLRAMKPLFGNVEADIPNDPAGNENRREDSNRTLHALT